MKVEILDLPNLRQDHCQPITCTRRLPQVRLANQPLLELTRDRALKAATGIREKLILYIMADCWLSSTMLENLVRNDGPTSLADHTGEPLAWTAETGQEPLLELQTPSTIRQTADPASYLIRFPWELLEINEQIISELTASSIHGEVSNAATIEGRVVIGTGTRILPGVFIEGNVVIGRNCKIGPNCYLRGQTSIGDNCHIGQAVEIKNSLIMQGTSIGHLSYCGDSVIGENVNFGAGTITANLRHDGCSQRCRVDRQMIDSGRRKLGTMIGDGVHTGIHTSIYPGRKMWPNTATSPGEIVSRDIIG